MRAWRNFPWALAACASLGACSQGASKPEAQETLIDGAYANLIVRQAGSGGSMMALYPGVFSVEGRCLILEAENTRVTPVFVGRSTVGVSAGMLEIDGQQFPFDTQVGLPGLGPVYTGDKLGDCPAERRLVRAVEP